MKLRVGDRVALALTAGMAALTVAVYPRLPRRLPTHFDAHGVPNGWMPRDVGAWVLPGISLALWLFFRLGGALLRAEAKARWQASPVSWVGAVMVAFNFVLQCVILYAGLRRPPSVMTLLGPAIGAFCLALGMVLPKVRRNPWLGVRTPWTLSSDENWARTHRVAGYAFALGGVASLLAVAAGYPSFAVLPTLPAAIVPIVYSFVLSRRLGPRS